MVLNRTRPPRAGQVAVDTVPTLVLGDNESRESAIIFNNGPATVYLSFDPNVSTSTGMGLPSGSGFGLSSTRALYAVAAAAGSTVSYMEEC